MVNQAAIEAMARLVGPGNTKPGEALRQAVVIKAQAAVPGKRATGFFGTSKKPYNNIFFPHRPNVPLLNIVPAVSSELATALLCDSIRTQANSKSLRQQMQTSKISAAVNKFNAQLTLSFVYYLFPFSLSFVLYYAVLVLVERRLESKVIR